MKNLTLARLTLFLALGLFLAGCNLGTEVAEETETDAKVEVETAANEEVAQPKEETVQPKEETGKPGTETKVGTEVKVEAEVKTEVNVAPRVIAISGDEYSFSPSSININKGEKVKVVFTNIGQNRHNWVIGGLNLSTRAIGSNETDTIEFTADATGTYEIFCSIAGHKEAGMKGSLTVN